jgi:hypothetical protein
MDDYELPVKKRFWTPYGVLAFSIILLLLGAVLTGTGGPGLAAYRAEAAQQLDSIKTACLNYQSEYNKLPETSENYRLVAILCGDNMRKIQFLYVKPPDLNPNREMIDPWKTPFRITFDSGSNVHVISAGQDKIFGTADDITNQ